MFKLFFENGNRRIGKLILIKLSWSTIAIVLTQVMGSLALLDFLSAKALAITNFTIGVILVTAKNMESFFDKTIQMVKDHQLPSDNTEVFTKEKTE